MYPQQPGGILQIQLAQFLFRPFPLCILQENSGLVVLRFPSGGLCQGQKVPRQVISGVEGQGGGKKAPYATSEGEAKPPRTAAEEGGQG